MITVVCNIGNCTQHTQQQFEIKGQPNSTTPCGLVGTTATLTRRGRRRRWAPLETVDLDVILLQRVFAHLGFVLVGEKVHHFGAMVSLQLNHLAHVRILDDGAIASCYLLESIIPNRHGVTYRIPS